MSSAADVLEQMRRAISADATWSDLARRCGVSPQAINKWRNRRDPGLKTVQALLAAYNSSGAPIRLILDGNSPRVEKS
ncbi:MAG: helix-turn-helix transcriptional regulator [Myxococcota bacterium]